MIQETILRNLANPEILKNNIRNKNTRQATNICVVWGFFHSENVDFHLGHLHMLQKARDFIDNQINVSFIINDHTELIEQDSQTELIYQKKIMQLKKFLELALSNDTQHLDNGIVHIGSEKSHRLTDRDDEKFIKDKQELETARLALNSAFSPLKDLDIEIINRQDQDETVEDLLKQKESSKSSIIKKLKLSEEGYQDLYKMLVGRDKFATKTEWASRFGALLASWTPAIDFVFVGLRHKYIWTYYKTLFDMAGIQHFPKILLAKDFYDMAGESPMQSNDPDGNIKISDKKTILKKFEDMMPIHPENCAFSNTVDYLIIPKYISIEYGPQKTKKEITSFAELNSTIKNRKQKIDLVHEYLLKIIGDYSEFFNFATREEILGRNIDISNHSILKAMSKLLSIDDPLQGIESVEFNSHPEEYMNIYSNFIENISSIYLSISRDKQMTLLGSDFVNPLKRIQGLVDNCKDMDLLLYLGEKNYRDHFLHQFNVASLGWLFISAKAPSGKTIMDEIINIYNLDMIKDDFIQAQLDMKLTQWLVGVIWWSCSLLHDHAYPISHTFNRLPRLNLISEQNNTVKMLPDFKHIYMTAGDVMLSPELIRSLQVPLASGEYSLAENNMTDLCRKYLTNLLSSDDLKVVEEKYLWSHSTLGAINLLSKLDDVELGNFQGVINTIAKSILLHEVHDIKIDFSNDPIPFLLAFCDEIQEWGRRTILDKDYVCPLDKITIGPIYERGASFQSWILFPRLIIEFPYNSDKGNFLEDNYKWSYDLFTKSKNRNLGRLVFPVDENGPFPQTIQYSISIPSKVFG